MEFAAQDDAIHVVGQHNGEAVALPLSFPEPNIVNGGLQRLPVQGSNGDVTERACLVGADMVIELGRKLKEAIYGFVHCACVLERVEGSEYYRRTPEVVAVKILIRTRIRQLAGRSQEDPMKVLNIISILQMIITCKYRKSLRYNSWATCTPT
jgi:hypothetical protein